MTHFFEKKMPHTFIFFKKIKAKTARKQRLVGVLNIDNAPILRLPSMGYVEIDQLAYFCIIVIYQTQIKRAAVFFGKRADIFWS
jgi:hypothetical protein